MSLSQFPTYCSTGVDFASYLSAPPILCAQGLFRMDFFCSQLYLPLRKGCMMRDLEGGGLVDFGAGCFNFSIRFSYSRGNYYHCHSVRSSLLSVEIYYQVLSPPESTPASCLCYYYGVFSFSFHFFSPFLPIPFSEEIPPNQDLSTRLRLRLNLVDKSKHIYHVKLLASAPR